MTRRLDQRVALITGAGSVAAGWGNGKAAATLFAREGAHVFAVDRSAEAVEETRVIIAGEGNTCTAHTADVTDGAAVKAMVEACLAAHGRIDILHCNVGGSAPGGPVEMSEDTWNAQIALNLTSVFLACKHVLPVMERQGKGVIITVSSVAGLTYYGSDLIAYKAAKYGLIQFTRGIAMQYAKKGIRANCVAPGPIDTPITAQYGLPQGADPALVATILPFEAPGLPGEVAATIAFLASDDASHVNGVELKVDGGRTA